MCSHQRLIRPLVIQPISLIQPFSLDTLHWLCMLKATLNSTPHLIWLKIFAYFLVKWSGADCTEQSNVIIYKSLYYYSSTFNEWHPAFYDTFLPKCKVGSTVIKTFMQVKEMEVYILCTKNSDKSGAVKLLLSGIHLNEHTHNDSHMDWKIGKHSPVRKFLNRLEKPRNFTKNTGKMREF